MYEAQHPPRLLFPALRPLYVFLGPLSWLLIRCACGLILAVHGWGKISRGAEAMAPTFAKLGYEHPVALVYLLIFVEFFGGIAIEIGRASCRERVSISEVAGAVRKRVRKRRCYWR